jgi:hypothetical protein
MSASTRICSGKADPFGLLVLAVLLALVVTIGIQAHASSVAVQTHDITAAACAALGKDC